MRDYTEQAIILHLLNLENVQIISCCLSIFANANHPSNVTDLAMYYIGQFYTSPAVSEWHYHY